MKARVKGSFGLAYEGQPDSDGMYHKVRGPYVDVLKKWESVHEGWCFYLQGLGVWPLRSIELYED